ncbi:hypothetical protein ACLKA7_012767 [Drosophila subpalustris]
MPRRYTKKLQIKKINETIAARKKQQAKAQQQKENSDEEDADSSLSEEDELDGPQPLRKLLETSRHDTHPSMNQGLGLGLARDSNAEGRLNIFPSASFTVPLPLYVANQTTPILDACRQRPTVHDDWMRQLCVYKSKYLKQTKKQKQREKKHSHNIYSSKLFQMAELIATQDNTYFRDSYDYYYTGGNLNLMSYSALGDESKMLAMHVVGDKLQQLHFSKVGEEAELWQPLCSESLADMSSEIFELFPVSSFRVNHGNMFLARLLNDIAIYELKKVDDEDLDEDEDLPKYKLNCQCKYKAQDGPFISIAQAVNQANTLAIACQDRSVRFLDIVSEQDISKHDVAILKGADRGSTWAQLRAWQEHCFYYACQSALLTIDMRCANEVINPCFASSVYTKHCESFSCLGSSVNPHLLYVASNHKLHCLDMRCLGKKLADRSVVTWTHQMTYPPTFMDAIAHEGSEFVAMSNAVPDDQRICELKGVLAENITDMCSPSLPYGPPQLEEALVDCRLRGRSVNIYADLAERVKCSTTGIKFHRLENASDGAFAQLLTANSVGDIFCQRVTLRDELDMRREQRTGSHTSEAILYYADLVQDRVTRNLNCTEIQPMAIMRDIMKSDIERDVEEDKPMPIEDIEIDYGFADSDTEPNEEAVASTEEQPTVSETAQQQTEETRQTPAPEEKQIQKIPVVNRGPWQKSVYSLSRYTDDISTRMLGIWDIDEFNLTRDVHIDMIDEKLKRNQTGKTEEDRTTSWLKQVPKPEEAAAFFAEDREDRPDLVPGTNLPTYFEAVYADYTEVANETVVDMEALLTAKTEASFNETLRRQPHSQLRPGRYLMKMSSRPRRMPNFTTIEENVLRMLTAKYKNVIEQKGSGAIIWDRKKHAWQRIEAEFFNKTKVKRPSDKLKSKYETMKKSNRLALIDINVKQEIMENVPASYQEIFKAELEVSKQEPPNPQSELEVAEEEPQAAQVDQEVAREEPPQVVEDVPKDKSKSPPQVVENVSGPNQEIVKAELVVSQRQTPQNVVEVPKDEPKSPSQAVPDVSKVEPPSQEPMVVDQAEDLPCKIEKNSNLSTEVKMNQEQFILYRNKEIRAQEKHLAELTNLEIQRKILELELKIKERIYNNNFGC